jgi:hypothetical protein
MCLIINVKLHDYFFLHTYNFRMLYVFRECMEP